MEELSVYDFSIGKQFRRKKAQSVDDYLKVAEKTHLYLEQFRHENSDGSYWTDPEHAMNIREPDVDLSYYLGNAGLTYFYLELYQTTGSELYRSILLSSVDYLNNNWRTQTPVIKTVSPGAGMNFSMYLGEAGIGMVLAQVYKVFGRESELNTIRNITNSIIDSAVTDETGVYWGGDPSMVLDGSIVLYLYKISKLLNDESVLQIANKAADTMLAKAIHDARGGLAWTSYAHPGVDRVPNFECGTAGIAYVLTVAYEYTKDERYLSAAKEAAAHLKAIAVPMGDGFLIPWHDTDKEEAIFYLSSCHGPAGTSKLFYQLYKFTGEEKYYQDFVGLYHGLIAMNAPETQSAGYWNNTCICCGTAGILQYLINIYLVTGDEKAKSTAITAGEILLGEQELKTGIPGVVWPLAFHRVNPEKVTRSIAYVSGSTGVAGTLLQLYLFLSGKFKWDRLFDDPFPEEQ